MLLEKKKKTDATTTKSRVEFASFAIEEEKDEKKKLLQKTKARGFSVSNEVTTETAKTARQKKISC